MEEINNQMKFERVIVLNYTGKKAHKLLNSEYTSNIMCPSFPTGKGKEVTWSLYTGKQQQLANLTEISKHKVINSQHLKCCRYQKKKQEISMAM